MRVLVGRQTRLAAQVDTRLRASPCIFLRPQSACGKAVYTTLNFIL
jgi:hypothetical protein